MAKARKRSGKRRTSDEAPWEHEAPKSSGHTRLTPARKSAARRRARKAGRPYPNLVDNMRAASTAKSARKKAKRKAGKTSRRGAAGRSTRSRK